MRTDSSQTRSGALTRRGCFAICPSRLTAIRLRLRLVSAKFAKIEEMKEGLGEIQLEFRADVPPGGPNRRLDFQKPSPKRYRRLPCQFPGPARPGYSADSAEPKRRTSRCTNWITCRQAFLQAHCLFGWWSGDRLLTGAAALLLLARLAWLLRAGARRVRPPTAASAQANARTCSSRGVWPEQATLTADPSPGTDGRRDVCRDERSGRRFQNASRNNWSEPPAS